MSSSIPSWGILQRKCACGGVPGVDGECAACRQNRLQRQPAGQADPTSVPSIVHEVLRSPGQPLNPATRVCGHGAALRHDFSRVRVHVGGRGGGRTARAVNALAYTVGNNVVFGTGKYNPQSEHGNRLLAHELAHVVQQNGRTSGVQPFGIAPDDHPAEREAEAAADAVVHDRQAYVGQVDGPIGGQYAVASA